MKRIFLFLLISLLCISLCSCDTLLKKAKSAITGEEESKMPDDYVASLQNSEYTYDLYEDYVEITKYIGENVEVSVPSKIDGLPVKVIGTLCFHDTDAAVVSVTIPASVTEIGEQAFYLAEDLVSITIPDTVKKIGTRAFAWCNGLENVVIGNGVTEIPDYCFNHCASLTSVSIPESIKKIGLRAFSYCEKLSDQVLPQNVESVGDMAFAGCPALEYVTVANNSITLGKNLFSESDNVAVISEEGSAAMSYCVEYNLRWSTSKDIEAVILGGEGSQDSSSVSE